MIQPQGSSTSINRRTPSHSKAWSPQWILWPVLSGVDELLLVLFGVAALVSGCFLLDIVQWVRTDGFKAGHRMLVNGDMVFIQSMLPVLLALIVDGVGSLPGHRSSIPLSAVQVGFIARCIRSASVPAGIEDSEALEVLIRNFIGQILKTFALVWVGPGLPDSADLDDDAEWCIARVHRPAQRALAFD